jgi:hypothetical protein
MAWTNLSFAYGSVLTSAKMTQMYDNFSYGTGSSTPAFQVGTTSSTEAVGSNNTRLATTAFCEAGFVNNDIGAMGIGIILNCVKVTAGTVVSGSTVAGSDLYQVIINGPLGSTYTSAYISALSGTWRNISNHSCGVYTAGPDAVFQRIS